MSDLMASSSVITLLLLLSVAIATFAADSQRLSDAEVRRLHKEWMIENDRSYSTLDEKESRFNIFKDNLRYIDEHNAAADRGEHTFRLGLTPFVDLTNEEYQTTYLGLQAAPEPAMTVASDRYLPLATDNLPDSMDWREKGAVAPVKSQRKCGGCWAFSTVSTVESINQIVTGKLITLSEQQLIDCDNTNKGCKGGSKERAFWYIIRNGGLASDEAYPYKAEQGTCNDVNEKVASIDSYARVRSNDEQSLKKAAANQPISVSIDAAGKPFQLYKSGIFSGNCTTKHNHAVVIIGYGTEDENDYWIVRNSWGTKWGEAGYIKMERNIEMPGGQCGIATLPIYPIKWTPYLAMPKGDSMSIA